LEVVSITCLLAPPSSSVPISEACRPRKEELLLLVLRLWWWSPTSQGRSSSYSAAITRNLLLFLHCCASSIAKKSWLAYPNASSVVACNVQFHQAPATCGGLLLQGEEE
jgi:hypothetical protein